MGIIAGLIILLGAAVAAYALLGLGGNTPAPVVNEPEPVPTPTPTATASLSPDQQIAFLEPPQGGEGGGEAARVAEEARFILAVSAEIPDPPSGTYYEVFLARPEPSKAEFSAGRMVKVGGRWVMTLDQTRDASAYSRVLVTVEKEDDGKSERTVLTGLFASGQ